MMPSQLSIGSRGYFFYLLFQCFIVTEVDGVDRTPHVHTFRSEIIGGDGAYIPFPSHSILTYMGPKVWMLMLDCRYVSVVACYLSTEVACQRAERRKDQVCSSVQYQRVIDALYELPVGVEHLIVQVGIPIAYPRMNFLEYVHFLTMI
jgi:PhoD related phosphatase